jgi:DEAD/DEAH box helicase domain-containing protein
MDVLRDAAQLVDRCRCRSGCPACVGDWIRDKRLISWALHNIWERARLPDDLRRPGVAATEATAVLTTSPRLPWHEVAPRWAELVTRLRLQRLPGAEALATLAGVAVRGQRLVLQVHSPGLAEWLGSEETSQALVAALSRHIDAPDGWKVATEVVGDGRERGLHRRIKAQRRHDDLVGGKPDTEHAANDALAGGYLVAGDDTVN